MKLCHINRSGPVFLRHTADALDVLCAQLTRDTFAIAKFLLILFFSSQLCLLLI